MNNSRKSINLTNSIINRAFNKTETEKSEVEERGEKSSKIMVLVYAFIFYGLLIIVFAFMK